MSGTWNTFNAPSGLNADTMLLLTDGTVLVHDANRPSLSKNFGGANWYRLTPDSSGDYRNGSWSGALPMDRFQPVPRPTTGALVCRVMAVNVDRER